MKRAGKIDLLHKFILGWSAVCLAAFCLTHCSPRHDDPGKDYQELLYAIPLDKQEPDSIPKDTAKVGAAKDTTKH